MARQHPGRGLPVEISLYVAHSIPHIISIFHPQAQLTLIPGGGLPVGQNRTEWPVSGGALSVIPGWNAGHPTAFFYINMNLGNDPQNFTFPIAPVFQIVGPSRDPYPGTFCLPDLPLPANFTVKPGDNATIQVIQVALHGASLYNVCSSFQLSSVRTFDMLTNLDSAQTSPLSQTRTTSSPMNAKTARR